MSIGYVLSLGYNSGYSSKLSDNDAWQALVIYVQHLRFQTDTIVAEARRLGAPEKSTKYPQFTLEQMAEWYKNREFLDDIPGHDGLFVFDQREHRITQLTTGGSGDRTLKEHVRRAFCRLVIEEMHRQGIEVNLEVV